MRLDLKPNDFPPPIAIHSKSHQVLFETTWKGKYRSMDNTKNRVRKRNILLKN